MEDLQNKDKSIRIIWNTILSGFGANFFSLVDFWDSDNFAFGLKKGDKLIYISTWDFREYQVNKIKCYSEFELIDEVSLETKENIKQLNGISIDKLVEEIKVFILKN